MGVNNNKEDVLSKINSYEALNRYLKPYHNSSMLKKGKLISNPFLDVKQKTPSFNIYKGNNGTWRYKDFATSDDGDVIDLIMKLKGVNFKDALKVLSQDFNLVNENPNHSLLEISHFEWGVDYINFWNSYNIEKEALIKFDVFPVNFFTRKLKKGLFSKVQSTKDNPIYSYKISNDCYKIYQPFSPKYKFSWLGVKPEGYVFGLDQLPDEGDVVFITGGEKDVMSFFSTNYSAISLNSETALPTQELISDLKFRFKDVVICYDIDETGLEQSKKIAQKYGLKRLILPKELEEKSGKDISDLLKLGLEFNYKKSEIEDYSKDENLHGYLPLLLKTQKALTDRKSEKIAKTEPILTQNGQSIIFPRTINIIQGKAGVHKSRLAETFCSVFIKHQEYENYHLGFKTSISNKPTVCYVDTERNLTDQFPYAIQQMLQKAGYSKSDNPSQLDYISLLEIPRKDRFKALTDYLNYVRQKFQGHLIIILDVVTDCIKDFNRSDDSMQLIDLMNVAINKYDVTFIGLIHENPGSIDKARGHLGTELMNKSSTVMQLGFEKGKNGKPTDLILLNFLKARSTKRFEPIYLMYCEKSNGLFLADSDQIKDVIHSRHLKAEIDSVIKFLEENLNEPISSGDLLALLSREFDCSDKIIRTRLKEIVETKIQIVKNKTPNNLFKIKQGKEMIYSLEPINNSTEQFSLNTK
ncbi:toprim domain-containing protein [Psychroserpens mesophilus]|uniref:toprim domain-containing protein n=1 Tax=Psychroserpens mesophilus TaxID=325473 RepID=UPI0005903BE3|nr:toprim domain-containing protein [Psychroserpens mesophilus]